MALKEKLVSHVVHHEEGYEEYDQRLSWEYMKIFSGFTTVVSGAMLGYCYAMDSSFVPELVRIFEIKELLHNLIFYCILTSIGQVFLYQILEKWGPLTLSIITGIRKIISIALSIILFGKSCSLLKAISLVLGANIIIWEILEKTKKNKTKTQ
jgi:drug/metabolite transporter (DMT)-like permease